MGLDTEDIRREIIRILESEGFMRSARLAEKVEERVGSPKTIYREIKAMAESGLIRRTGTGQHISYDLQSATKKHRLIILKLLEYAENNYEKQKRFHDKIINKEQLFPGEPLMEIVTGIQQLQKIEARFKIIKMFTALKKLEDYENLEKQIEKNWKSIRALIVHNVDQSQEPDLISQVLMNFEPIMYGFMTPVEMVEQKPVSGPKQVFVKTLKTTKKASKNALNVTFFVPKHA